MADRSVLVPSSGLLSPVPVDDLVGKIAQLFGSPDDQDARDTALSCLDRAAGEINLSGTYLFGLREAALALTSGTATVSLPSDFAWPYAEAHLLNADGSEAQLVHWLPWDKFRYEMAGDPTKAGAPFYMAIRDVAYDGTATVYPTPDDSTQTIRLAYLTRVSKPSQSTLLLFPEEVQTALLAGGEAHMAKHVYLERQDVWGPLMGRFDLLMAKLRAAGDRQQSASEVSFGLDPRDSSPGFLGWDFIRLG